MAFYLRNFNSIPEAKDAILYSPTFVRVQDGENDRVLGADVKQQDAPLTIKGIDLPELYIIPAPTYNVYFMINDNLYMQGKYNQLPNPMPTVEQEGHIFKGWFLNKNFTIPATSGIPLSKDTYVYGRLVSNKLTFYLKNATDASKVTIADIDKIKIYGTEYSGNALAAHYNSETQYFTFDNLGDSITYSIITTEGSSLKNKENIEQSYDSLNNNAITLVPKTATLGDITVILNWAVGESENNIFDMYTVGYLGEAPEPIMDPSTNKILELSYNQHGTTYNYPLTGETDFKITYTTFGGDWSRGEYTTITRNDSNSIKSLEDILRKYSFVFIVNDYTRCQPGQTYKTSTFGKNAPEMSMTLMFGTHEYIINLTLPEGQQTETGDKSVNWIAFKTRILGKDEEITNVQDIITVYSDNGYSLFDATNSAKTKAYDINNGGRGIIK